MDKLLEQGLKWLSLTNYFSTNFQGKFTKLWGMVYIHCLLNIQQIKK